MTERKIRPGRITDEQVEAFIRAAKDEPYGLDAIRAGLAAAYVRREVERITTPELSHPDLDPYPASVDEVADEIARYVLELEASGVANRLVEKLSVRLVAERQKASGW